MSADLEPGRWWRVVYADHRTDKRGHTDFWCETSDETEARQALKTCPGGGELQRIYEKTIREWRSQQ